MESQNLDVAIVAANYNNGLFLEEFINSILNSSKLPKQLIIVDDGSTDNSKSILDKFKDLPFANFIYFEKNKGFGNALNAGIEIATAKYIMRADPDDIFHENRIEKQFEFLENNPQISGIGCNVSYFLSGTNKKLNNSNFPIDSLNIDKAYRKGEHGMQHPSILIRAEAFKKFKYIQENVPAEDYDIFARMVAAGYKFQNLSEVLYNMRIHDASASSNIRFNTIKKTFELRDKIFKTKTSVLKIKLYYLHILNYRRFLLENNGLKRIVFLLFAIVLLPKKLLKRI